jgi:glycylpeptide N-tetradecanoyltransferase
MIVGIPRTYFICGKKQKMAEINFLAVHQKLRDKRLAQIIIAEMMRRCRIQKLPVQFYTSHHTKPTPFATNGYKLRFLNTERLLDCGITRCGATQSYKDFIKQYKMPDKKSIDIQGTTRLMEKKDAAQVLKLWNI